MLKITLTNFPFLKGGLEGEARGNGLQQLVASGITSHPGVVVECYHNTPIAASEMTSQPG